MKRKNNKAKNTKRLKFLKSYKPKHKKFGECVSCVTTDRNILEGMHPAFRE